MTAHTLHPTSNVTSLSTGCQPFPCARGTRHRQYDRCRCVIALSDTVGCSVAEAVLYHYVDYGYVLSCLPASHFPPETHWTATLAYPGGYPRLILGEFLPTRSACFDVCMITAGLEADPITAFCLIQSIMDRTPAFSVGLAFLCQERRFFWPLRQNS